MHRARQVLGSAAGVLVVFCLPLLTHALPGHYNPPIYISELVMKFEPDGEPIRGPHIALGETVCFIAETIYDLDATSGPEYTRDRIVSATWQRREVPDGDWEEIPGGTLVETDYRIYKSMVTITLKSAGTFSIRITVDDDDDLQDDDPDRKSVV